ncbi:MAG: putative lipid II flippase FtsW [Chloroflexi bacterium]|nr:putative lipid II flippase FtsW [Chloroflexota bacterium]
MAATVETRMNRPDYILLALTGVLVIIGLQWVYSSSFVLAVMEYNDVTYFVVRQGVSAIIGLALLIACMNIDYHRWRRLSPLLMLGALVLMAILLIPGVGTSKYGATRWISLGPLPPIQPTEFVKLFLVVYVSAWLAARKDKVKQFSSGLVPFTILVVLVSTLVMIQPDMGTTIVIVLTAVTLFFLAGADVKHLLLIGSSGAGLGVALISGAGYRFGRWESFINPWDDPAGKGFHIIQLLIALGSGGLTGLGPGASRQKFFYVPGSHTDGIFAIIGEELGFVGGVILILLFAFLTYRGFKVVHTAGDEYGRLLAAGIICTVAFQALINIGGITRSIPMTGIPLPLISYGGSSLVATMASIGILLNVSRHCLTRSAGGRRSADGAVN